MSSSETSRWVPVPVGIPAPGESIGFEVDGRALLVCATDAGVFVLDATCPHGRVSLEAGALRGCVLECPLHGGKLDVRTGAPVQPPIRTPARTYAVRAEGEKLEVLL